MVEHDGSGKDLCTPRRITAAFVAVVPLLILWIVIFASHRIPWRVHYDQSLYHEPAIRNFIERWPSLDLYDYLSATTPGYHLIVAMSSSVFGDSPTTMRIVSGVIALVFVGFFGASMSSRVKPMTAGMLAWPLACSMYVVQSAVYLLPDNLGWLAVCGMVVMALRVTPSAWCIGFMGVWLVFVVCARQVHAWTFGLVLCSAWLAEVKSREKYVGAALIAGFGRKIKPFMIGCLAVVPGLLLLYGFVRMWDGPVPPRFASQYPGGVNAASTAFTLSLIAIFGVFQIPVISPTLGTLWRSAKHRIFISATGGLLAAALTPTNFDYAAGRRSGLWNVAAKLPNIGHTSLLILVLSTAGAVVLLALLKPIRARDRIIMCAAFAGFCLAAAAGVELWQRYTEPFIIMFIALLVAMNIERADEEQASAGVIASNPMMLAGSTALSCIFCVMSIATAYSAGSVPFDSPPPPPKTADDTSPVPAPVDIIPPPPKHGVLPWMQ